jgi:hypothetical protein
VQRPERIHFIRDWDELHGGTTCAVAGPDKLEFTQGPDGSFGLHELIRPHLPRPLGIVTVVTHMDERYLHTIEA